MIKKTLVVLIVLLLTSALLFAVEKRDSILLVYGVGTPDSYGNRIQNMTIYQWNGTIWIQMGVVTTYDNYTYPPRYHYTLNSSQQTMFNITVYLNQSLASSASDAAANHTLVRATLSGVTGWSSRALQIGVNGTVGANYYSVEFFDTWTSGPAQGGVYNLDVLYEALY